MISNKTNDSPLIKAAQLYTAGDYNKIADYLRTRTPQQVEVHARVYNARKKQSILSASTEALIYNNQNMYSTDFYSQGGTGGAFVSSPPGVSKYPVPSLSASANEWSTEEQQALEECLKKYALILRSSPQHQSTQLLY